MHSPLRPVHCVSHHFQAFIGNRERCVAADCGFAEYVLALLQSFVDFFGKTDVLPDSVLDLLHAAVAVRDLIACGSSDSDFLHTLCYRREASLDVAWGCMVVDAACRTRAYCIERADERGVVCTLFLESSVESPPPFLENLDEVRLGACGDEHSPAEPRIVVVVGAYVTGNEGLSLSVDDLLGLESC